jgi:hypothetical protein
MNFRPELMEHCPAAWPSGHRTQSEKSHLGQEVHEGAPAPAGNLLMETEMSAATVEDVAVAKSTFVCKFRNRGLEFPPVCLRNGWDTRGGYLKDGDRQPFVFCKHGGS